MTPSPNLKHLQKKLDYQFKDIGLLEKALTHRSAAGRHNERLEFLGDAILGSIIAHQLYLQFPKADEGQLSRLRAFLVKEKALFELAQELDLGDFLRLGSGELKSGGYRRASILSDAFEAIIGAVYLDSDFIATQTFVLNLYRNRLGALSLDMAQKDPKTRLQEWLQARNIEIPEYEVTRSVGKDHAKTYWVNCKVNYNELIAEGKGASRRKAEQDAAEKILEKISNG
ncbi:ribonuclease III [Aliikangiella coralliicola]|uniref:Ribonuclease 3 n=1 Tax=Aliikangiella coralliicola TaxID=2592383 RepID=A0A545UB41_9GAMM|nr:ribonuclease III [Aliikangiella coralliicola]TQV86675.1 ribonuclease III [Aliikangiella coralliicola]